MISNPGVEWEKAHLDSETNEFTDYLIEQASMRGDGRLSGNRSKDIDVVNRTASPLGCLFAWAAAQHEHLTLTANTLGLVYLYEKFGFEVFGRVNPIAARYLKFKRGDEGYAERKYTEINLPMKLKDGGAEVLLERFPPLAAWIGDTL